MTWLTLANLTRVKGLYRIWITLSIRYRSASTVNCPIGRPLITLKSLVTKVLKSQKKSERTPQTELDGWRFKILCSRQTSHSACEHTTVCRMEGTNVTRHALGRFLMFQGDGRLRRHAPLRASSKTIMWTPVLRNQHATFIVQTRRVKRTLHQL